MQPNQSLRTLGKRQLASLSPRLGVLNNIPFAIPFEVRVKIFRHFVFNDKRKSRDVSPFLERTRAEIRRGHVASDGFDKLSNADLKGRLEISFIDAFGEHE